MFISIIPHLYFRERGLDRQKIAGVVKKACGYEARRND
ncbi:hypothetical protein RCH11_000152 [Glaciihabitans sp. GrIS 2.15]|nr:hypothetical protein [Glaciihabitans sp. GrIS 2.15]